MRSLPAELIAEFAKEYYASAHLFVFTLASIYRYTDYAHDIYFGGNWYIARIVKFDAVRLTSNPRVESVSLKIEDIDKTWEGIILSQDIRFKKCEIFSIPLDKNIQVLGSADKLFIGYFDKSERPRGSNDVEIKVYNHMILWSRTTPRRTCSPTCQWDFKHGPDIILGTDAQNYRCKLNHVAFAASRPVTGANWASYWELGGTGPLTWTDGDTYLVGTCRYAGAETWCDRSFKRCQDLANTLHFGGFRWISFLQDKKIWWGQTPKKD